MVFDRRKNNMIILECIAIVVLMPLAGALMEPVAKVIAVPIVLLEILFRGK